MVNPSYDAQHSSTPWEYNAAMDNVVGTWVYAIATNVEGHQLSKFGLRLAGTAPGVGELPFVFASGCFGWAFRDGTFDVHEPVACGDRERVCAGLVTERE